MIARVMMAPGIPGNRNSVTESPMHSTTVTPVLFKLSTPKLVETIFSDTRLLRITAATMPMRLNSIEPRAIVPIATKHAHAKTVAALIFKSKLSFRWTLKIVVQHISIFASKTQTGINRMKYLILSEYAGNQ